MNKITRASAFTLSLIAITAFAGNESVKGEAYYIKSPQFAPPLIENLITEYNKANPSKPITATTNKINGKIVDSAATYYTKHKINTKQIKNIYFVDKSFEEKKENKSLKPVVVYTSNSTQSLANLTTKHYKQDATAFKGKKIAGDDAFLSLAVAKDPKGITFNARPNIYDLGTRQIKTGLALLPVDFSNVKTPISTTSSLDELLTALQDKKIGESVM